MKRSLRAIGMVLCVGCAMTIAVAWSCALWAGPDVRALAVGEQRRITHDDYWCVFAWAKPGVTFVVSSVRGTPLEDHKQALEAGDLVPAWSGLSESSADLTRQLDGRGWPMIALWCEYQPQQSPMDETASAEAVGAIDLSGEWRFGLGRFERALPLRLAWVGFLANTLLYASIAGVVGFLVRGCRRIARRTPQRVNWIGVRD